MLYAEADDGDPRPLVTDDLVARAAGPGTWMRRSLSSSRRSSPWENLRSRMNAALGLTAQGFRDQGELPAASRGDAETFVAHRDLMFAVAYRILARWPTRRMPFRTPGSAGRRAPRDDVTEPRAYLARTVTNLALNRLRAAQAGARGLRRAVAARAAADPGPIPT